MASLLAGAIQNISGRYVAAYALLFVGTLVATTFVTHLASQLVRVTGLTLLDRLLGTGFGFARGIILILVVVYILRQLVPPTELLWLEESVLMSHVDMLGRWAQDAFARASSGQWPASSG
jgi:membrane protein required for colicin V production